MELIKFEKREQNGPEWIVKIINIDKHYPKLLKEKSLIQVSISWCDYVSWPYLHMTMGGNGLLSFLFLIHKFGIDIDLLSYTWKLELQ